MKNIISYEEKELSELAGGIFYNKHSGKNDNPPSETKTLRAKASQLATERDFLVAHK